MAVEVSVVEMHTNGEPFRIVLHSDPEIEFPEGATVVEKRRFMKANFDIVRKVLMLEPRGHADMYGCVTTSPDPLEPQGDFAVLFFHHSGYSLMCGHGTMALARFAVDRGLVPKVEPESRVAVQCPCGVVEAFAEVRDGKTTGQVRLLAPTGFLHARDLQVEFRGRLVTFDLAYGGTFYAIVSADAIGLKLESDRTDAVVKVGMEFKRLVAGAHKILINDPAAPPDYLFLYGLIIADARRPRHIGDSLRHVILFAEGQIDRSPCGSGTTARLAALATLGLIDCGREVVFNNPLVGPGSTFRGRVLETGLRTAAIGMGVFGVENGVRCELWGRSYYSGKSDLKVEQEDVFPEGLTVR